MGLVILLFLFTGNAAAFDNITKQNKKKKVRLFWGADFVPVSLIKRCHDQAALGIYRELP